MEAGSVEEDWKAGALARALEMLELDLSSRLGELELKLARETYRTLFQQDLESLGEVGAGLGEPVFQESMMDRLNGLSRLEGPALMQSIRHDRLVAQIREADRDVERAARDKVLGISLPPRRLAEIEGRRAELPVLALRLRRECPHLEPAVGELLSESQLDCMYLLDNAPPMSLRVHRLLQTRS